MALALTTATGGPNVVRRTYISPAQQKLLDAFVDNDYFAVADALLEIERDVAPNPGASRLFYTPAENMKREIVLLMALRNPDELRAIWRNELPQRMNGSLAGRFRSPGASGTVEDPVIYLNFVAGSDGCGVATDDYEYFLTALDIAAGVMPLSSASPAEHRASDDRRKVFAKQYPQIGAQPALRNALDATYKVIGGPGRGNFFHSQFNFVIFRNNVQAFTKHHRAVVLPAARLAGFSHIALPGECGLAIKGYDRCKVHRNLSDGPPLFRLFSLACRVMFKGRGFKVHQVYLFDIFIENIVDIGESIGSLFTNAYPKAGGTNTEQAGISQNAFQDLPLKTWKLVAHRAAKLPGRPIKQLNNNIGALKKMYERQVRTAKATLEDLELRGEMDGLLDVLSRETDDAQHLIPILQDSNKRVKELLQDLARRRAEDAEELAAIERGEKALRDLKYSVALACTTAPHVPGTQPNSVVEATTLTADEAEAKRIEDQGNAIMRIFHADLFSTQSPNDAG